MEGWRPPIEDALWCPCGWNVRKGHVSCGLHDLEAPGRGLVLMGSPVVVVPDIFNLANMVLE